jgi:hypothetical protein
MGMYNHKTVILSRGHINAHQQAHHSVKQGHHQILSIKHKTLLLNILPVQLPAKKIIAQKEDGRL